VALTWKTTDLLHAVPNPIPAASRKHTKYNEGQGHWTVACVTVNHPVVASVDIRHNNIHTYLLI